MEKKVLAILPVRNLEAVYLDEGEELASDVHALVFWRGQTKEDKNSINIRLVTAMDVSEGWVDLEEGPCSCSNLDSVRDKVSGIVVDPASIAKEDERLSAIEGAAKF